jgi:DNA polymerase V
MNVEFLCPADYFESFIVPFFTPAVSAGFPSPAQDYIEEPLDLKALLIKHPAATFFVRAAGDSMIGAGIHSGDILVVDRSLKSQRGRIVIAVLNGEMTVKRLAGNQDKPVLLPENSNYKELALTEEMDFKVWGVVTAVLHFL